VAGGGFQKDHFQVAAGGGLLEADDLFDRVVGDVVEAAFGDGGAELGRVVAEVDDEVVAAGFAAGFVLTR